MNGLTFSVVNAEAVHYSAAPSIAFRLRIENRDAGDSIQSVALRCQILIEASRRRYNVEERAGLSDLFGEPERWSQTLRPLLWAHAATTVPAFDLSIDTDLPVPCTFDFNVGAAKYFHGVKEADIPLCFQFSGTIFHSLDGALRIEQIGWDKEAKFRLPSQVWRDMMDHYYPNSAWLRLRRDAFDRLHAYKRSQGMATWEEAIESLIPAEKEVIS